MAAAMLSPSACARNELPQSRVSRLKTGASIEDEEVASASRHADRGRRHTSRLLHQSQGGKRRRGHLLVKGQLRAGDDLGVGGDEVPLAANLVALVCGQLQDIEVADVAGNDTLSDLRREDALDGGGPVCEARLELLA